MKGRCHQLGGSHDVDHGSFTALAALSLLSVSSMASPSPPALLLSALRGINSNRHSDKDDVFVTLTFAQSLDAKIAGVGGQQLILSGKESMIMTHWSFMDLGAS
jgi:hypothetical protein